MENVVQYWRHVQLSEQFVLWAYTKLNRKHCQYLYFLCGLQVS